MINEYYPLGQENIDDIKEDEQVELDEDLEYEKERELEEERKEVEYDN